MKCDELKRETRDVDYGLGPIPVSFYDADKVDAAIAEKDAEIAQWKDNARHYPMLVTLIDEGNKQIAELKAENEKLKAGYVWQEYDAVEDCWEDKHKGKWVQNPELRATRRNLWLMTAEWADAMGLASCNIASKFMSREKFQVGDDYREKTIKKYRHRQVVFCKYADYCRAKAEEYR